MRRRLLPSVAFTTIAALALAGCASSGNTGSSSSGGQTVDLTFRQFDPPGQIAGLTKAVDEWNKANPRIQVKLETLTDPDNAQQFAREANSGSGPDVVQIANANVKDLANPKILLPIDKVDKGADPAISDYLSLDMVQFDKKTWALPWTVDTFALIERTASLTSAGVSAPKTWDALAGDAKKLSKDGQSGFCFPAGSGVSSGQWFLINYYLWSHGSTLVKQKGGTWTVGAGKKSLQDAIDYFNGLITSGATPKSLTAVDSLTDPQITQGVTNGSCAMTLMSPATFRNARATSDAITSVPMPEGLIDGNTHLGGRSLGINASTKHPAEAWKFIEYLNSTKAIDLIGQYPASKSALAAMKVPTGEEGFQQQLPHSQSFGRYIAGPVPVATLQKIVNAEFGAVYSGQSSSADAAQSIISQIQSAIDQQ